MNITSDTSGLNALIKRIEEAKSALPTLIKEAAHQAGQTVSDELAKAAPHGNSGGAPPPGDASGTLAQSFHAVDTSQGVEVQTNQSLKLQYVTKGTGVHIGKGRIMPTTKKALHWDSVTVRSVAGQRANNFVDPVLSRANTVVEAEMQKVIQKLNSILGG